MLDNCARPAAPFSPLYYRLPVISDQVGWRSGNVVLARARDKRETLREARVDCINITYPSRFTIANTTRVRSRITRNWRISTTRDNSRRTILRVLQSKRTTFVLRVLGRANQTDETACANTCVHAEMYAEHHANFSLKKTHAENACAVIRVDLNRRIKKLSGNRICTSELRCKQFA